MRVTAGAFVILRVQRLSQQWQRKSSPAELRHAAKSRARRRADGDCINHDGVKATHGCRCWDCWITHRYGKGVAYGPSVLMRDLRSVAYA